MELAGVSSFPQLLTIKVVVEFRFSDDLPHDVAGDDVVDVVSQTSFDILATHRYDLAGRLGHEGLTPDASLHQDRVLPEAVTPFQFEGRLLVTHYSLFDDVEGVGVVAFVENHLSFFVVFAKTG